MPLAAVDLEPLLEMAIAAIGFGLGAMVTLSMAVAGFSRSTAARDLGQEGRRMLYAAVGAAGALGLAALAIYGVLLTARG